MHSIVIARVARFVFFPSRRSYKGVRRPSHRELSWDAHLIWGVSGRLPAHSDILLRPLERRTNGGMDAHRIRPQVKRRRRQSRRYRTSSARTVADDRVPTMKPQTLDDPRRRMYICGDRPSGAEEPEVTEGN